METKVVCPKCGSEQISANKKGFSGGKAAAGLLIPGGLLWGFHGSKKVIITCLACGKQFNAGEGKVIKSDTVPLQPKLYQSSSSQNKIPDNTSTKKSDFTWKDFIIMIVILIIIFIVVYYFKKN